MGTLSLSNIKAATEIRESLTSWDDADAALEQLRRHFPSNTQRSHVLAKASAIDKLYSTRASNIYWVANAVVATMQVVESHDSGEVQLTAVDVVNLVSQHKTTMYPKSSRCASFASKYCHFFVGGWEFPIYDSFALTAVNSLLGKRQNGLTPKRSEYQDFCERVERVRARDGLEAVGVREMDRFLWLWGQWLAQRDHERPVINTDVYNVFRSKEPQDMQLVEALHPEEV